MMTPYVGEMNGEALGCRRARDLWTTKRNNENKRCMRLFKSIIRITGAAADFRVISGFKRSRYTSGKRNGSFIAGHCDRIGALLCQNITKGGVLEVQSTTTEFVKSGILDIPGSTLVIKVVKASFELASGPSCLFPLPD